MGGILRTISLVCFASAGLRAVEPLAQQAYLKADHSGSFSDIFGFSVAVSGDTVVIGAPFEDGGSAGVNGPADELAASSGAAYVFVRSGTTWTQQAYLKASQVNEGDNFGYSVAVSGDTVVVGAQREDGSATGVNGPVNELAPNAGAAYVFVRNGTTWSQQAYLKPSQVSTNDFFGRSVAISGDTVVVGANQEDGSATGVNGPEDENAANAGAAYVFVRNGTTWSQQAYLKASQVSAGDTFGRSVAVSGDTVVVGAYQEDGSATGVNGPEDENASNAGAAYVFARSGTTWSPQAYLKAIQVTPGDLFGCSVAVSGDTVVVGAYNEDGSATGVDGPVDELAGDAGAAYVFVRSGTTWSPQAYLKASQAVAVDNFGFSVAIDGDTVVVGANGADGGAPGTVFPPGFSLDTGEAHVFTRSGTTWTPHAYLKAGLVSAHDQFGFSVAVAADTVVVGAINEDGSAVGVNGPVDELSTSAGAAYVFAGLGLATFTPWQRWQQAQFGANSPVPALAGEQADPDGDGGKNLLEYALATHPNGGNAPSILYDTETIGPDSYLRLHVPKNPSASDVEYTVEVNDNLLNPAGWNGVDTVIEQDTLTFLLVRDAVPAGSRYIRLKVNLR